MNDSVFCRRSRDGQVGMAEFDCVGDDLALGVCVDKLEAAVGIHGGTNVESILGTKIPRALFCRFGMNEELYASLKRWVMASGVMLQGGW